MKRLETLIRKKTGITCKRENIVNIK
jgi:hypothetical protein